MLHISPTNCLLLTAKQEPYKKSLSLNEKYWRIFWKKFRRKGQQAEKDKTERVTRLGRRTREEIAKWNQMTALRFQTGGRHQTSPASLRGSNKWNTGYVRQWFWLFKKHRNAFRTTQQGPYSPNSTFVALENKAKLKLVSKWTAFWWRERTLSVLIVLFSSSN